MKRLIETGKFNTGMRPSTHNISLNAFAKDNGGSIAHNLFELEDIDPSRDVRRRKKLVGRSKKGTDQGQLIPA